MASAVGFLDNATVQIAVYDAVEAIDGRFKPYHVHIPGASGSPAAAAAKAAHDVLVNRFPAQTASWTRPTTLIWQPTVCRRATPASPLARRQRRVSLLSGQMTGASHPMHRPSRVALLPASGARRLHTSPDHLQLSLPR